MTTFTALNILKSWLRANNLKYEKADVPGYDILVFGPSACTLVRILSAPVAPVAGSIDLLADDIGHEDLDTAMEAYHTLTRAIGAGEPKPFNRGQEPTRNFYGDEEFLTDVRHCEVRRSPNPSPAKYKQYDKVMHKAVWTYYNVNREFCRRMGLAVEDLMTYAHTMFISFCARLEDDSLSQDDNEKKLYVWLRQRFGETFKTMTKRERSTVPDCDTVSIGLLGKNYRVEKGRPVEFEYENDPRDCEGDELMLRLMGSKGTDPTTDLEYRQRRRKIDVSNPGKRKASAKKLLNEYLDSLDHDSLVEKLAFAAQNILIHPDARREAGKRLAAHEGACEQCKARVARGEAPIETSGEVYVDEEPATDRASVEE